VCPVRPRRPKFAQRIHVARCPSHWSTSACLTSPSAEVSSALPTPHKKNKENSTHPLSGGGGEGHGTTPLHGRYGAGPLLLRPPRVSVPPVSSLPFPLSPHLFRRAHGGGTSGPPRCPTRRGGRRPCSPPRPHARRTVTAGPQRGGGGEGNLGFRPSVTRRPGSAGHRRGGPHCGWQRP
jgi:hypothetical protein